MGESDNVCILSYFIPVFWLNLVALNRDSIHPPILVPDSASVTRSPTGSIPTILSIDSNSSQSSGSRLTVFVPPLSTLPDISDFQSNGSSVSRQSSLASSYHSQTVDDTVIQNQEYVDRGDPRVITPSRGSSMRRSGSMTDLDEAFKTALSRARGAGPFGGSPVTISSGSTLGKNIFVTPPPSIDRLSGSDRPRSDGSGEHFFSAGSTDGARSNVSSTYFSQSPSLASLSDLRTATNLRSDTLTIANSETQVPTTAFSPSSYRLTESGSFQVRSGESDISIADSPSAPSVPLSTPQPPSITPSAATVTITPSLPSIPAQPSASIPSISSLSSLSVVQPSPPSPSPSLPPVQYLPLPPATPASLSRATSDASSFNSYLSSHHSDGDLYDEPIYALSSPPLSIFDDDVGSTADSPTLSRSSSLGPSSAEWLPAEPVPEVRVPSIPRESISPQEQELPLPPESPLGEPSLPQERPLPPQPAVSVLSGASEGIPVIIPVIFAALSHLMIATHLADGITSLCVFGSSIS